MAGVSHYPHGRDARLGGGCAFDLCWAGRQEQERHLLARTLHAQALVTVLLLEHVGAHEAAIAWRHVVRTGPTHRDDSFSLAQVRGTVVLSSLLCLVRARTGSAGRA